MTENTGRRVGPGWIIGLLLAGLLCGVASAASTPGQTELRDGWFLTRADAISGDGAQLSAAPPAKQAIAVKSMPATVLKALTDAGQLVDPYIGDNLARVDRTLWQHDWWYQTRFNAPAGQPRYSLVFNGISYRGEVWLNGQRVAGPETMTGMWRRNEFDVTGLIKPGEENRLAVRIQPEQRTPGMNLAPGMSKGQGEGVDLADTWVDWINFRFLGDSKSMASWLPDKNGGITGRVYLTWGGPVTLRHPYVASVLPLPRKDTAALSVYVDAANQSKVAVSGVLRGTISRAGKPDLTLEKAVTLAAGETRELSFTPADTPALKVTHPDLWWPYIWGDPALYHLSLRFDTQGKVSDDTQTDFGIRSVTGHRDNTRLFPELPFKDGGSFYLQINGRDYPVRGAAYTPDLFYGHDPKRLQAVIAYAKDMGINLLRQEGKFLDDDLLTLADREGIPVMRGLVCCGAWEQWDRWDAQDHQVARDTVRSVLRELRGHASAALWANGSDGMPPEDVLADYRQILTDLHWQNAVVDTLSQRNRDWSGIHMSGPYTWRAPVFWFDGKFSGARGSVAEEGSDEIVPPPESLKKFIPADSLWPVNPVWEVHGGSVPGNSTLDGLRLAVTKRYGAPANAEDFARRAQLAIYEGVRAQFEAYSALDWQEHKFTVYWMLNSPWPSFFGQLFDWYLKPGGAYFGAKKALRPLSVVSDYYASGDHHKAVIRLVNQTLNSHSGLQVRATVYDLQGRVLHEEKTGALRVAAQDSEPVMTLPRFDQAGVWFIRLRLSDSQGQLLTENVYWQSRTDDQPDLAPLKDVLASMKLRQTAWADFSALQTMPAVRLESSLKEVSGADSTLSASEKQRRFVIRLTNPTSHVAFFVRATLTAPGSDQEVLPISYDDNYITVWPHETRTVTATTDALPAGSQPGLHVDGVNVP
ncbi:hypothetical protein BL250_15480 [Erwinia sp. OLTSP20]|uniref:glycoside hydrolase family 2 protein n=1 Tax=unclassified Erwinia TaxID=2622719 RepID=UPI000C17AB4E|nr:MULTISPECIES: glycoside hydrolase [unclassified Erwinia]PIJ48609.1 hypothetical protein BV501_16500 [Erwinia sp. OAMSP11]PIJ68963.1 hypothetical protein BK416_15740 [Erwinia sp. OLSSP12]PIJ78823.1 hypothetical protein BLD47_16515 [Erwinia sp. OLCASP19]PIJ79927.1 hypothetical protein BLD46_16390 [Erwinia sp. OLMTSP26]PIJ82045.1 hypothetical protein BLD49_15905 [Erwinia sp. OLMDSP33]